MKKLYRIALGFFAFSLFLIFNVNVSLAETLSNFTDAFDSTTLNTTRYATKITGNGSITQDGKIVASGTAANQIVWDFLYTNQDMDFTKDFSVSADINLTGSVSMGDAMAMLGVEDRSVIATGLKPTAGYCELSTGGHGTMIRMESSGMTITTVPSTTGTMVLSYNAANATLTCSFGGKTISEVQQPKTGSFAINLRSGIHEIHEGMELPGTGNFTTTFDNLAVTTAATPPPTATPPPSPPPPSPPPAPVPPPPSPSPPPPPPPPPPSTPLITTTTEEKTLLADTEKLSLTKTLRLGSRGKEVKILQKDLRALGFYKYKITGFFGKSTRAAVVKLQKAQKLSPNGVVGRKMREKINLLIELPSPQ